MTETSRLDSRVDVAAINSQLGLDAESESLNKAMDTLHTDYSFGDNFKSEGNYAGVKTFLKVAAFVLTLGGLGVWAVKARSNQNAENAARQLIRNPESFTEQVRSLHAVANTVDDSLDGKLTHDHRATTALGSAKDAATDLSTRQSTVTGFQGSVETLQKAIDTVANSSGMNATERRALYGAFVASAVAQGKEGLSQTVSSGMSEQAFALTAAKKMWHSGNAQVVGQDIASKMQSVPSPVGQTHAQRMEALEKASASLEDLGREIYVEAARVVAINGGPDFTDDVNTAMLNTDVTKEAMTIRKQFAQSAAPKIQSEVTSAIGRINGARDIEALKKSFLEDRKGELRALSGNTKKGEEALRLAVQFNGLGEYASNIVGDQINQSAAVKEAREDLATNLSNFLGSLESATKFVEDLNSNFATYVEEKEEEAQANADLIGQLLEMSPMHESTADACAQLIASMKAGVQIEAKVPLATSDATALGTVSAKIDSAAVKGAKTLDTADYISLLKIVVGDGKDNLGSPTLARALMDSLSSKGQLPAVFTALNIANASQDTSGFQASISLAQAAVAPAEENLRQAQAHEKTFYFSNDGFKAAQKATQDREAELQEARSLVSQLQEQLRTAASHIGSNAYVAPVARLDGDSPQALGSRALHNAHLVVEFTDAKDGTSLHALREALAKSNVTSSSVDSSGKADGKADAAVVA